MNIEWRSRFLIGAAIGSGSTALAAELGGGADSGVLAADAPGWQLRNG